MRGQGVYLRDTRHRGNEGGAYRAARSYLIAKAFGIGNELNRDHIKHGKAVFDNGVQLSREALGNDLRHGGYN